MRAGEVLVLGAVVVAYVAAAVVVIAKGAPLGHDEAVYALRTRTMVEGSTAAYFWNDFRAPGFPALLSLVFRVRGTEPVLRLAVAGFGGVLVVTTWWLGRSVFGAAAGLIAGAGVAFTPALVASSTAIWPDIPGAALGLLAVAIVYGATRGPAVSWWVLTAVPVALLAIAVRYGAPLPIGIGVLAVLVLHRRFVAQRPLPVVAAVVLTLAGAAVTVFTPWVFGTADAPYASIRALQRANDFPIYQGLVDYAQQGGFLVLTVAGVLLVTGIVVAAIVLAPDRELRRGGVYVAATGGLTLLAILVTLHGEYRYLAPVYPWLWILAGYGLVQVVRHLPRPTVLGLAAVVAGALVLAAVTDGDAEAVKSLDRFRPIRAAGRVIETEAAGAPCGVVTSYVPQLSWYSGCVTRDFELDRVVLDSPSFPAGRRFMVLVAEGKRQPEGDLLEAYESRALGPPTTVGAIEDGALGYVEIYRLPEE